MFPFLIYILSHFYLVVDDLIISIYRLGQDSVTQCLKQECNDSNSICHGDTFRTPCVKASPKAFVAKRSSYLTLPDYSPLPDTFSNVVDEDTWLRINKGHIVDLDSLQMTLARKVQSFPSSDATPVSLYCFIFPKN